MKKVGHEAIEVAYMWVVFKSIPPNEELRPVLDVVTPGLILQELLPHKQHRNARSCKKKCCRNTRAASSIPGTRVRGVRKLRQSRSTRRLIPNVPKNHVMVLEVL